MSFERLGSFAVRRRWAIVGAWLLLLLVALPLAPRAPSVLSAGGFVLDDLPSSQARLLLEHELDLPPSALVLVYTPRGLTIGTPQWSAAVNAATSEVATAPHVKGVLSHLIAPRQVAADGSIAYDVVLLDLPADDSPDAVPPVAARLHPVAGLTVEPAGGPVFYGDVQSVSESDLRRSEVVSLPLAGLVLLLVFASVVAAGIPLVVGGAAVIVALATIYIVGSVTSMSVFVLNLATLLGLGLGVDYSLLMTSRFREELARRKGPDRVADAVRETVATAGRAVFFSGLTVLLGLLGLVLFEFMILRSVGIAGALVVGLAVAAAVTLMPAILAIVGTRIDSLAVRRVARSDDSEGRWARLARRVMRHPVRVFVPTLGLLLVLGLPFLHVRFNAPDATILPASVPSRAAYDRLAAAFGEGEFAPLVLAIRTNGPATSAVNLAELFDYSRRLAADPRIRHVAGLVDLDPRLRLEQYQLLYGTPDAPPDRFIQAQLAATTKGDLTAFTVTTPFGPNAEAARALVRDLRTPNSPLAAPAGMQVLVGGGAADVEDVVSRVWSDFPRTALFIFVATYA
ncbi:MAG: MMPL family transporter, partial [Chloroflexota bacterium]